jgi:hypothetical protein
MKTTGSVMIVLFLCGSVLAEDRSKTRLRIDDLQYLGAFRVPFRPPEGQKWRSEFSYGGTALAYNPNSNSLFLVGHDHHQLVAEISIPDPVKSDTVAGLPTAKMLQPFVDVTGGLKKDNKIGGLLVDGDRLLWTSYVFYDAAGQAKTSHGVSTLDLLNPNARGMYTLKGVPAGAVAGYMSHVPKEWRKKLGVRVLTGLTGIPIVGRSSGGPAAVGFDPDKLVKKKPTPTITFLYYPVNDQEQHPLARLDRTSKLWNLASTLPGMVFVCRGGKSAVIFFGRRGLGTYWYGEGVQGGNTDTDPYNRDKGPHAPPYEASAWFYDPSDLLAVKSGRRKPWQVKPYLVVKVPDLFKSDSALGGSAYDPQSGRLYISEMRADKPEEYYYLPVIQVYKIRETRP